jgi:hypothetical protein
VQLLTDAASLESGKIFYHKLRSRHGPDGAEWLGLIHGQILDSRQGLKCFTTVKYGVPVKGMISWQTILNPENAGGFNIFNPAGNNAS